MNLTRQTFEESTTREVIHQGKSMAQADVWVIDTPEGKIVVKDITRQPLWWKVLFGRRSLAHEARILKRLQGIKGVPRLDGMLDHDAIVMEYLDARRLPRRREVPLTMDFIFTLKEIVKEMHARGVAHGDLRRKNILQSADGEPCLIDFTTAVCTKSGASGVFKKWLYKRQVIIDDIKVLRIQRGYIPDSLTKEELQFINNPPFYLRIGRFYRQKIYRPLKHIFRKE